MGHTFAALSFLAEIFIFLYVGMDVVRNSPGQSIGVSSILLGLILLGRAAFVFPLWFLSNLTKSSPDEKIDWKKQVTIWWAGLMRGAVSMALAYNQFTTSGHIKLFENAIMITSTITVLFNTVSKGLQHRDLLWTSRSSIAVAGYIQNYEPLISSQGQSDDNLDQPISVRMLWNAPSRAIHYYWRKFDNAVMRRIFGGRGISPIVPGSPVDTSVRQWSEEVEENKEQYTEP
ncbi:unnamed protein product [Thlaspi arvense]|uniref:Cation/H+ exchanger transmembrane domain-containing protein n=1 Tax=Thlaspi arvense TaxID=13288 RepID=A0AAU9S0M8_THLAR|nr:unnamed protein product [Thlaspi arvense]